MIDKIIKSFAKRSRNTKSEASNDSPLSGLFILPIPHLTRRNEHAKVEGLRWLWSDTFLLTPFPLYVPFGYMSQMLLLRCFLAVGSVKQTTDAMTVAKAILFAVSV